LAFMPFQILGLWFRALFAPILLCLGIFLVAYSVRDSGIFSHLRAPPTRSRVRGPDGRRLRVVAPPPEQPAGGRPGELGVNLPTALLACGAALVLWSLAGGWIRSRFFLLRRERGPAALSTPGDTHRLARPDGTE